MIIYISESLNSKRNGGSSTSGFEFLQFLRIKYQNVVVLTYEQLSVGKKSDPFYGEEVNDLGEVVCIKRKYPVGDGSLKRLLKKVYYWFKDFGKKSECNLEKYYDPDSSENVIYVNSWSGIYENTPLINHEKFKKVCIVRGSPESFVWQSFGADKDAEVAEAARYLEQFDELIFVSSKGLDAWNALFEKPIKSYYLPNSINEEEVKKVNQIPTEKAAHQVSFSEEHYNVVCVGSLQKRKAQDIILEVAEEMSKLTPNIRFHLIGVVSEVWGGAQIKRDIQNSPLSEFFVFHGHSDQALLFMKASDLLLFTSRAEAFPRTVAEYMTMNKPILAADVSGVSEMIEDGVNGFLYDPHKPETLIEAYKKFHEMKEESASLGEKASETYFRKFSKAKHIEKALDVFGKIEG